MKKSKSLSEVCPMLWADFQSVSVYGKKSLSEVCPAEVIESQLLTTKWTKGQTFLLLNIYKKINSRVVYCIPYFVMTLVNVLRFVYIKRAKKFVLLSIAAQLTENK